MSTYEEMYFGPEKFKHRAEELRGRRWQKKETIPWFYCREGGLAKKCQYHRLSEAWVGYRDKNLEELYYLVDSMTESLPCLPEESRKSFSMPGIPESIFRRRWTGMRNTAF